MTQPKANVILEKLTELRAELVDLAFTLECRGHLDAADVAMTTSARVAELCEEFLAVGLAPCHAAIESNMADIGRR